MCVQWPTTLVRFFILCCLTAESSGSMLTHKFRPQKMVALLDDEERARVQRDELYFRVMVHRSLTLAIPYEFKMTSMPKSNS